jgi:small nuclear ribonucleoprotein B and B'
MSSSSQPRFNKMFRYLHWKLRVRLSDRRSLLGSLLAFDRHLNLILADCEEVRITKGRDGTEPKEERRVLGLLLIRGETVISINAEAPPPPKPKSNLLIQQAKEAIQAQQANSSVLQAPGRVSALSVSRSSAPLSYPTVSAAPRGLGAAPMAMQPTPSPYLNQQTNNSAVPMAIRPSNFPPSVHVPQVPGFPRYAPPAAGQTNFPGQYAPAYAPVPGQTTQPTSMYPGSTASIPRIQPSNFQPPA